MKKSTRIVLSVVIGTLLTALAYYVVLPPVNVFSPGFWTFLLFVVAFYGAPLTVFSVSSVAKNKNQKPFKISKALVIAAAVPVAVLVIGGIVSSTFFNARRYAEVISVQEAVFSEDMPEADTVTNISLMDTDSAVIIGNRALGALSDVVSQYNLSYDYNQINYKGTPQKVANLEYVDFFRYLNNSEKGIPGYVMVDPVNSKAEYIKFDQPLYYVDSAFFGNDLMRKLRFSYPTKIFSTVNFEIDENGDPWFIVSCVSPRVGLFGAMDVSEVIIFNPCDGSSEIYPVSETPSWIDNVYDGSLACEKYDWYGTLSGGYWNSVIGNKNCRETTDGYGYIVRGDDVWYYTGVTSLTSDESNIGFIITNARTGEYKYYPVVGAEEYSAMGAAEGEVQEKGYKASFPSLINVDGQATYIMVLKDSNGLVKLYALVNAENYSVVATGDTQTAAKQAYRELLVRGGLVEEGEENPDEELASAVVTVEEIRMATVGGESVIYLIAGDGFAYKGLVSDDESLMLLNEGDILTVTYSTTTNGRIRLIARYEIFE